MGKPQLPRRSPQAKFACGMATPWLGGTVYLFMNQQITAAYLFGGALIITGLLVSTIDLCIPSILYNALFIKKVNPTN